MSRFKQDRHSGGKEKKITVSQLLRVNFHVQPNQIRPRTKMWRQEPGSTHIGKLLQGFMLVFLQILHDCTKRKQHSSKNSD